MKRATTIFVLLLAACGSPLTDFETDADTAAGTETELETETLLGDGDGDGDGTLPDIPGDGDGDGDGFPDVAGDGDGDGDGTEFDFLGCLDDADAGFDVCEDGCGGEETFPYMVCLYDCSSDRHEGYSDCYDDGEIGIDFQIDKEQFHVCMSNANALTSNCYGWSVDEGCIYPFECQAEWDHCAAKNDEEVAVCDDL